MNTHSTAPSHGPETSDSRRVGPARLSEEDRTPWLVFRLIEAEGASYEQVARALDLERGDVVALVKAGRAADASHRARVRRMIQAGLDALDPVERWCPPCCARTEHTAALHVSGKVNCLRCGHARDFVVLDDSDGR